VGTFVPDEHGATLSGLLTNVRRKPNPTLHLTFEFLNGKGDVVATEPVDVAAIAPGENQPLELKPKGSGIVAWRYNR
jgi:hypothetical protein